VRGTYCGQCLTPLNLKILESAFIDRKVEGAALPDQAPSAGSVDEVANLFESTVVQLDSEKSGVVPGSDIVFEVLEDGSGEISLSAQQTDERGAVGWVLVITRKPA